MHFTFDPSETGWAINASAQIADGTLRMQWGVGSDPTCNRTLTGLANGATYALWVKANMDAMPVGAVGINVQYDDGNGGDYFVTKASLGGAGSQIKYLGLITGAPSDRLLRINGTHLPGFLGVAVVEDVWIGEDPADEEAEMSKRRDIRSAIVARIQAVTVANGYALDIQNVVVGPTRLPDGVENTPHVSVTHGEEVKSLRTLTALGRKDVSSSFMVGVVCKRTETADPDDLCDDACGEIEKALELHENGAWSGFGTYVSNVFVTALDPVELPSEIAKDM